MDSFLKFLEENCPGDDAHSGAGETNKPLLQRCGLCASIYEAHLNAVNLQVDAMRPVVEAAQKLIHAERWPYLLGGGFLAHAIDAYEKTPTKKRKQEVRCIKCDWAEADCPGGRTMHETADGVPICSACK